MPDLADGETVEMKGSGTKPYQLKNVGGVYSCTCPAWRNQSVTIEKRTCKHLRKLRGDVEILDGEFPCGAKRHARRIVKGRPLVLAPHDEVCQEDARNRFENLARITPRPQESCYEQDHKTDRNQPPEIAKQLGEPVVDPSEDADDHLNEEHENCDDDRHPREARELLEQTSGRFFR